MNDWIKTLIIWKTWSGKTVFLKEKIENTNDTTFFVLDPLWHFNNIKWWNIITFKEDFFYNEDKSKLYKNIADIISNLSSLMYYTHGKQSVVFDEWHYFFWKNKDLDIALWRFIRESRAKWVDVIIATQSKSDIPNAISNMFNYVVDLDNKETKQLDIC